MSKEGKLTYGRYQLGETNRRRESLGVTLLYIEIWLGIRKGPWLRERTGIPLFPHRWELAVKEFHGQS